MTTKRDEIWSTAWRSNTIIWTVDKMMNEVDSDVSERTVRNVLNVMADEGLLEHRWNESKWIAVPEYR